MLNKQIKIYSIDTKAFLSKKEQKINKEIIDVCLFIRWIREYYAVQYLIKNTCNVDLTFNRYYLTKLKYFSLKKAYKEITDENEKFEYSLLDTYFRKIEKIITKNKHKLKSKDFFNKLKEDLLFKELNVYLKSLNYRLQCEIINPKIIKIENEIKDLLLKLKEKYQNNGKKIRLSKKKLKNIKAKNGLSMYEIIEKKKLVLQKVINKSKTRTLNNNILQPYNQVSVFESYLTRILDIKEDEVNTDLFIIKVNDHEHEQKIIEQLIKYGFLYNGKKYCVFTASAGQIRKHKIVFISETVLQKNMNTLMCGLTSDKINNSKYNGCNINKWLAYLALTYSATDKWEDFNIDKAIVVEDFEINVDGIVDYIDNKTFVIEKKKHMSVPINISDGCGMYLYKNKSNKPFMFRMPFFKGLIVPVPYLDYTTKNKEYKVKDIYGKEWDLKQDNIEYIFTKSQFKMWKYYSSWDEYKSCFKKYNCHAGKCNEESDNILDATINYQMMQSLTDIRDNEIDYITKKTVEHITNAYSDVKTMLSLLGVSKANKKMNYMQQALYIYPELFKDYHNKKMLEDTIQARKKDARYAKLKIEGKYTFLIPDVYAWLEFLLDGNKTPKGLLNDGDVFCSLYKNKNKLAVLRSPHLYREWAIRKNKYSKEYEKWYCTKGLYTSCQDLISKILQFDNDGDSALVVADSTIINIAERNLFYIQMNGVSLEEYMFEYGFSDEEIYEEVYKSKLAPLYYQMDVAPIEKITKDSIIESMKLAWKYGNIGEYSNKITTIWNDLVDLDLIAILTAFNNFSIDAAKTKYMVKLNKKEHSILYNKYKNIKNIKLPYFFKYAKEDKEHSVAEINDSTVNRICKRIDNIPKLRYKFEQLGKFDYKKLMSNPNIEIVDSVIEQYILLNNKKNQMFMNTMLPKSKVAKSIYDDCREQLLRNCSNLNMVDIVDIIIQYAYTHKKHNMKTFLWEAFGDIIVDNLKRNVEEHHKLKHVKKDKYIECKCGNKFEVKSNRQTMCKECAKEKQLEWQRNSMKKSRNNKCEGLETSLKLT